MMKGIACVVLAFIAVAWSQEAKDKEGDRPTVFQRLIPADVLRGKKSFYFLEDLVYVT